MSVLARISTHYGSTRAAGLLRIGLALLIWSRFAQEMALFSANHHWKAILGALFFLVTACMLVGFHSRTSAFSSALFVGILYFKFASVAHHKYLLFVAPLLLSLTPCGASYSLDRWLAVGKARQEGSPLPEERGDLWALRLIALQVSAVYFWGAFDKSSRFFLSGEPLQYLYLYLYSGSDYPAWPYFPALMQALAVATVGLEYLLAFALWSGRYRRYFLPIGMAFHFLLYYTIPVYTFSLTMILLYLAFVDPDAVHEALERVHGNPGARA